MKTFTACLLLTFATVTASAQNLAWAKGIGSAGEDAGNSIATDAAGNVYTTGLFEGTVDFDPNTGTFNLTAAGKKDIFISKLDAAGNFQWALAFGDTGIDRGRCIITDNSGNIYMAGNFSGVVDFDPGPGISTHTAMINQSLFILKINPSGNLIWSKSISYNGLKVALGLTTDAQGNVYTTGDFNGSVDFDPGVGIYSLSAAGGSYVLKLDATGNFVWARVIGRSVYIVPVGECVYSTAIAVDAAQNVYTAGHFIGPADFDPSASNYTLEATWNFDPYVSKLDANGNFVWVKAFEGPSYDFGTAIAIDTLANIYACGFFSSTTDFDGGAGTYNLTPAGDFDAFVVKLDSAGNLGWARALGGIGWDGIFSIARDPAGNLYTTGRFNGTADMDPGAATYTLNSAGIADVFVCKLDPAGNLVRAKRMGGAGSDEGRSIAVDGTGNILCTGSFSGTADFDPTPGTYTLAGGGLTDIFIAKLDTCSLAIASQPSDQSSLIGGTVQFTMASSYSGATFQWQMNTGLGFVNLSALPGYSGVNSSTLTISNIKLGQNNYGFRCVVNLLTCMDISAPALLKVLNNTGITETGMNQFFTVYPIPSGDLITIATTNLVPVSFTICDQIGKPVLSGTLNGPETTVDLESLASGLYFISVGNETKKPKKIIKQ